MDPGCGWRFKPDPRLLLDFLRDPVRGRARFDGAINEGIDPYSRQPEQLQNVSEKGSYYYYSNRPGRNRWGRNRQTADGIGHWKAKDKKKVEDENGQIVGYGRKLIFFLRGDDSKSTRWAMMEYTLPPDGSHDALKAICMIYKTAGNRTNQNGQPSTNPLPVEPDDEDIYGQLSPLLVLDDMELP